MTMAKVLYFLLTFLESGLALFGIRSTFETPPYRVLAQLGDGVEIRRYGALTAAETSADANDGQAFSRLFRYIGGANQPDKAIAMTAPVEMRGVPRFGATAAGDSPAGKKDDALMRFFLPEAIASDPPPPKDPRVRIVHLPAHTVAVLRFSGWLNRTAVDRHIATLRGVLKKAGRETQGEPYVMGYDPPFTIPFLRQNEVAVDVAT